jgi:hypothetical protein
MENESKVIFEQMTETRTALSEKVERLEHQVVDTVQGVTAAVADTVDNVKEAVQDTMQSAKQSVAESVEHVKRTFDLKYQVERSPWTMMAGATALGYLGARLLIGRSARGSHAEPEWRAAQPPPTVYTERNNGTSSEGREPGFVAKIGKTFESEFGQLKELAVGTLFSLVRDMATEAVPEPMENQVRELIDAINVKLGGRPIRGPIFPESQA